MRKLIPQIAVILLLGVMYVSSVPAFDRHARPLLAQQSLISQDEAAAQARSRTGGRVLDIRATDKDGRPVYLVKLLLSDGHVRVVTIDAASGEFD